jgi:DNA mismatch endonuclease (patch repair protein)
MARLDPFQAEERSAIMRAVRSRGNRSTEQRVLAALRAIGARGWRRHFPLPGCPDFAFPALRVAIFVDGCFWHGCPKHWRAPVSDAARWAAKVARNRRRDRAAVRDLRARGWQVIRIWEHALRGAGLTAVEKRLRKVVGLSARPKNLQRTTPASARG